MSCLAVLSSAVIFSAWVLGGRAVVACSDKYEAGDDGTGRRSLSAQLLMIKAFNNRQVLRNLIRSKGPMIDWTEVLGYTVDLAPVRYHEAA